MDIYDLTVPQLQRVLGNIHKWLDRAAAHEKGDALLACRLAPDQFPLSRQVQVASDNAKMLCGRLAGREWPSHPDTETTIAQLQARLASVGEYVKTFERAHFAEAADRKITLPWMKPEQYVLGANYVVEFALPNFYFHVVTAYSILRHEGLQLGKFDYIGGLTIQS